MKLISLNTWGGQCFNLLLNFIKQHSQDTDIFCFQEMHNTDSQEKQSGNIRANLLSEIKNILPNFQIFYFPIVKGHNDKAEFVNFDLTFGSAIFVKNPIKVDSQANYIVSQYAAFPKLKKDFSNLPTPLQYVGFTINSKEYAVFNFHGTPYPGNKLDTSIRLMEAQKTKEIINQKPGAKILIGDFNLLPRTESIKIFEKNMRNLIKEFNIPKTRSSLSPFYGTDDFQKFADYTFVSNDIIVNNFLVPKLEISDHLPMILQFS